MRHVTIILTFFTFISCSPNLTTRLYKNSEETTGGFCDFYLELSKDGILNMNVLYFKDVDQTDAGTVWQPNNQTFSGKWFKDKKSIKYVFDNPKSYIDSLFFDSDFINTNKPLLYFSPNIDTAYIYGIPCVITPCTNTYHEN